MNGFRPLGSSTVDPAMFHDAEVVPWMRAAGTAVPMDARVTRLSGGVSNVVMWVESNSGRWVVKQSLGRLDVPGEWHAPRERILAEAAALDIMGAVIEGCVPPVVIVDEHRLAMAMVAAPAAARDWRDVLFSGGVDRAVGRSAGRILGQLHKATTGIALPDQLVEGTQLETLRLDPYFREAAKREPEIATYLDLVVEHLAATSTCLVHGDYSPKNLLSWPGHLWVIDTEVAHRGEPVFDVAFLTHHLLMKALVMPGSSGAIRQCWLSFAQAYEAIVGAPDEVLLTRLTGALLIARVLGKSPALYLQSDHATRTLDLGRDLRTARRDIADVWSEIAGVGGAV